MVHYLTWIHPLPCPNLHLPPCLSPDGKPPPKDRDLWPYAAGLCSQFKLQHGLCVCEEAPLCLALQPSWVGGIPVQSLFWTLIDECPFRESPVTLESLGLTCTYALLALAQAHQGTIKGILQRSVFRRREGWCSLSGFWQVTFLFFSFFLVAFLIGSNSRCDPSVTRW